MTQTSELNVRHPENAAAGDHIVKCDVVVVGSGAGGGAMAFELSKAGYSVIVLEAGPYVPSSEFNEQYGDMFARLYQDAGRQTNTDGDIVILQGACVGGSTVVNAALCFRTPEPILAQWRDQFGLTDLTAANLDPIFARVERNLSVHANEPHEISANAHKMNQGCDKLGYSYKPLSRNTRDCTLSGYCLAGCATDRKQSTLVTYLPWAMDRGAKVYAWTRATRILHDGTQATGVEAVMTKPDGTTHLTILLRSKIVVVCAGAVQTPILLARSGIPGLSPHVGKNFACHPSLGILGVFEDDVFGYRGATCGTYCDEFDAMDEGGFILESGSASPDFLSVLAPGFGPQAHAFMKNFNKVAGMITLIHDENVGTVTEKNKRAAIEYRLDAKDIPRMRQALSTGARVFLAAGAKSVVLPTYTPFQITSEKELDDALATLTGGPVEFKMTSYHPQGTCRMTRDAQQGVVSPSGEVHALKRLFVADASLFPSSIMVNPQITVYALSTLVAERILSEHRTYLSAQ